MIKTNKTKKKIFQLDPCAYFHLNHICNSRKRNITRLGEINQHVQHNSTISIENVVESLLEIYSTVSATQNESVIFCSLQNTATPSFLNDKVNQQYTNKTCCHTFQKHEPAVHWHHAHWCTSLVHCNCCEDEAIVLWRSPAMGSPTAAWFNSNHVHRKTCPTVMAVTLTSAQCQWKSLLSDHTKAPNPFSVLRFVVLKAVRMKMTAFRDTAPRSLAEPSWLRGQLLRDYRAQYPIRL